MQTFSELSISPFLKANLARNGYKTPTAIQAMAIEPALAGKDVVIRAQGWALKRVKVEAGPPDKPAEITITMETGHHIKGLVTDQKRHPLEGVRVYFAHGNHAFSDGGKTTTDAQGHFTFDSLEALGAAMGSEGTGAILADVANYTTISPVLQTSEIV